jgi:hypothetical protein
MTVVMTTLKKNPAANIRCSYLANNIPTLTGL